MTQHIEIQNSDTIQDLSFNFNKKNAEGNFITFCKFSMLPDGKLNVWWNPDMPLTDCAQQFIDAVMDIMRNAPAIQLAARQTEGNA